MRNIRATAMSFSLPAGILVTSSAAWAHPGHDPRIHFMNGFLHPLSGLDHLLAMIAVGLFASCLGGRALWAVPLSFLTLMIVGGILAMSSVALPFVEPAIALSVAVFGIALILHRQWTVLAAMALVGTFAVFHGYAHGAEMPKHAVAVGYALGFVTATALLHLSGIAIGLAGNRVRMPGGIQTASLGGFAFAFAGLGLLLNG